MTVSPFWMVWNPEGRSPTYQHASMPSAQQEAKRLAKLNPGQRFFVLSAVSGFAVPDPVQQIVITPKGIVDPVTEKCSDPECWCHDNESEPF